MSASLQDRIAVRAHLLSKARTTGPADPVDDWLRAEPVEFIWFFVEQAVKWAQDRYNGDWDFRFELFEVGNVFWHDSSQSALAVGATVTGTSGSRVSSYLPNDLRRFLDSAILGTQECLGDIHTHLFDEELWAAHLPSYDDIQYHSALWDLWSKDDGQVVPVRPVFQLVQSNLFGDVIAVLPHPERPRFTDFKHQHDEMARIGAGYRAFQEDLERRRAKIPEGTTHEEFVDVLRSEVTRADSALGGRANLVLFPNHGYCLPPEELADENGDPDDH